MFHFINICGFSGILILLVTIILLITGIVIVSLSRSKKMLILFAILSLLPLSLGVLATSKARLNKCSSSEPGSSSYNAYQENCAEAKYPTYLGAGSSALLLFIAGIGAIKKKK